MSIDIIRPHRVTKCPQKPQSDPTVCHFDWVLTIFINFEGVAGDGWRFQGYRYTQGTFGCYIQAKKITTVYGPPFQVFSGPPRPPQNQPDPYNGPSPPLFIEYYWYWAQPGPNQPLQCQTGPTVCHFDRFWPILAVLRGLPGVAGSFEGNVILRRPKGVVSKQKNTRLFTTVALL